MSSIKQRDSAPGNYTEAVLVWSAIGVAVLVSIATWVPTHTAARLDGTPAPPGNPARVLTGLVSGEVTWTRTTSLVLAALILAVLTAGVSVVVALHRRRHGGGARKRVDRAARRMGRGCDITGLGRAEVQRTATRLGIDGDPGLRVATTVSGRRELFQDWESVSIDLWGPRAGKSSSRAIPAIMAAPGAVLATSNKRDIVDATRDPRATRGEVWVFDPQEMVNEPVTWWWNPLTYVTDETKARSLAEVFAAADRRPDSRSDDYFESAGMTLLAGLLLAAAAADRSLTQVYLWATDPNDDEPAQLLDTAGYPLIAAGVRGYVNKPDKERSGIYGSAHRTCSFMTNRQAMAWVTPPRAASPSHPQAEPRATETTVAGASIGGVREFSPEAFVRTTDTLYSLSREGTGSAAPLVTALTVAVCEAAEDYAKDQPHGRLPIPMIGVLDEAANVCRWAQLPNLYSHYGSRGINLLTFLQSWSQGVEVWGREGMRKIWSAANVKVYGGGISEVEFLDELSRLIGDYQHLDGSVSYSRHGGRSTSQQRRTDRILDVADLAALDRGRVVVFAAGSLPVLAQAQPWWQGSDRDTIAASLAAHDPSHRPDTPTASAGPVTAP